MMEILTYVTGMFDISLFWLIIKHKGRSHFHDEIIQWLHWLFDFTYHWHFPMIKQGSKNKFDFASIGF